MPPAENFPKRSRLLKRSEYLRVQKGGRKLHTRSLLLLYRPNALSRIRLGIAVSRKYGKSVQRNRIKRLVRELFRRNRPLFPESVDLVIIPKRVRHQVTYQGLLGEIAGLARIAGRRNSAPGGGGGGRRHT